MSVSLGVFHMLPWLQEKTLNSLQSAVSLVDLANEPDTTAWYKRKLIAIAEEIINRLAPVVTQLFQVDREAASHAEVAPILESGSFALAKWCKKWGIADPQKVGSGSIRHLRSVDENEEKAEELFSEPFDGDVEGALDLKNQLYGYLCRRLLNPELTDHARKMMLWMMGSLWLADPPDVVAVSKRFLPTDLGVTPKQAQEAYRLLHEQGLIERVADDEESTDRLRLRLVAQGLNDSKHAATYEEVVFGYPGARINGKVTMGECACLELPKTFSALLGRWFKQPQELSHLRDNLQMQLGEDTTYVESAEVKFIDDKPRLFVQCRYPIDADSKELKKQMVAATEQWLKERLHLDG